MPIPKRICAEAVIEKGICGGCGKEAPKLMNVIYENEDGSKKEKKLCRTCFEEDWFKNPESEPEK